MKYRFSGLREYLLWLFWGCMLCGCQYFREEAPVSSGHIQHSAGVDIAPNIPQPVRAAPSLPPPEAAKKELVHTVVVNDVPLRELLFSLARDADLNLDIDSDVDGQVTLNAVNQPLSAILERLAQESGLRYHIKNNVLRIRKDTPFLRSYRIDYLNMIRNSKSNVSVSTQISSTGQGAGEASGGDTGGGGNNSSTSVENISQHAFWQNLQNNIAAILQVATTGENVHPDIISNRESGVIAVRATQAQHREIQGFIDEIQFSTRRQVLIEATIAEVKLSDSYQAGIDWSMLRSDLSSGTDVLQTFTDLALFDRPSFTLSVTDVDAGGNLLQSTLRALETFGDVRVMSSPKVMALNNQTALLKVVDNLVYFTVEVNIDSSDESGTLVTYETEVNTVPVGFVMSVTPYINEFGSVTLNVRPTISRVIDQVRDPNPSLASVNVISEIPVIQVREVESVLKVASGNIAVIGGLMQDEVNKSSRGIPVLGKLPIIGPLFRYDEDQSDKTELVIFIKPQVLNQASLTDDLQQYRHYLPTDTDRQKKTP